MTNQQQVEAWHQEWLESDEPHWGDRIAWSTADEIARRLDELAAPEPKSCTNAPDGWYCVRPEGHDGPCHCHKELDL